MLLLSWAVPAGVLLSTSVTAQSYGSCSSRTASTALSVSVASTSPFALSIHYGDEIIQNSAILLGATNSSATPVSASMSGGLHNGGQISASVISTQVVKISVDSSSDFVGARFSASTDTNFYGVWEYPWNDQVTNAGIEFDLKGVGNSKGINWSNARAPFFLTDAGYGVYADTLSMGSFNFTQPGDAQFIFNTSSLVYYVIVPQTAGDIKSILQAFAGVSNTIDMPPDSGYGPTFWSDDFEQDFHGSVTNAQENYYDVINHLYYDQIHASSMFADRPYGTGNSSFGNFGPIGSTTGPFDPAYYPTPQQFIANLSHWGFDFQVWVANRAFLDTTLYNTSVANGWLFPGIDPEAFLGPALNLSIPAAYQYLKKELSVFPAVGVKGYKIDRGEEGEMPVWEQNIQMTLFEQLCYETMAEKWGIQDRQAHFYSFARSAVDRSRSKTNVWNGDSYANFTGLAYSVASGIRAGLIGFSQWGSDTGGYVRDHTSGQSPPEEVWARWMWFSAFSPVYELMLGTNHTPWYPPYSSDLVTVLKQTANLHHELRPYIKSYTYQAHITGIPVMRALFLETPADTKVRATTDQYFFGSEMLIAPILNTGGTRSVYFPGNTKYLEYFNKSSVHAGGSSCEVDLGVHAMPVYVRAGAIVPRGDTYQGNNKWAPDWKPSLTVELYPSTGVPYSGFAYYNGAERKEVPIVMLMDIIRRSVTVEYGSVGINGTLILFDKTGTRNAILHAVGGSATFANVQSLFDS